jgi:hypothetical protein
MPDGEHEVTKRKRILSVDLSLRGCQKQMQEPQELNSCFDIMN